MRIDMNSDVGESFGSWTMGDDAAIFRSVSSANVACGFHAGDPSGIAQTCRDAVAAGVTVGAHVGYRDLAGFGRRFLNCTPTELADDVLYQIGALQALARAAGVRRRAVLAAVVGARVALRAGRLRPVRGRAVRGGPVGGADADLAVVRAVLRVLVAVPAAVDEQPAEPEADHRGGDRVDLRRDVLPRPRAD